MTDPLIKKAGDLSVANYKPDLTVVVSDPSLASLPDNDPLKQSKVIQLSDILSLAKNWDVTPEAIIGLADPVVTDTVNCTVDNQTGIISFDLTTAPVPTGQNAAYHIGVAKTNTTLSALVPGTATFVVTKNGGNYSTVDIPSSATQLNEQARIKCPVKLKYGDSLVFNMVNNTTTNPFTRLTSLLA